MRVAREADLAAVKAERGTLRADNAEQLAALSKQVWLMAVGRVGLTVTLVTLIP